MVIERRVELFGVPITKRVIPTGAQEVLRDTSADFIVGKKYEDVVVGSDDVLFHRQGEYLGWEKVRKNLYHHVLSPLRTVQYTQNQINEHDIEKRKFGVLKVKYSWRPNLSMDPYKSAALDDLVRDGHLTKAQADKIIFEDLQKQKRLK